MIVDGRTIEGEILGQSIEVPLHEALLESIGEHIAKATQSVRKRLF